MSLRTSQTSNEPIATKKLVFHLFKPSSVYCGRCLRNYYLFAASLQHAAIRKWAQCCSARSSFKPWQFHNFSRDKWLLFLFADGSRKQWARVYKVASNMEKIRYEIVSNFDEKSYITVQNVIAYLRFNYYHYSESVWHTSLNMLK